MTTEKDKNKTNDDSNLHKDEIGENTGDDTQLAKEVKADKPAGDPASSNKGQGPSGEDL